MIPISKPIIAKNASKYLLECLKTGWVSSKGPFVEKFENAFAKFVGTKYAVACSSGTHALHLALASLNIGPGDEVIVPALTMIAAVLPIIYLGATPVLVDSEEGTGNLDVSKIEEKITRRTKAIIPVHLYGQPCEIDSVTEVAKKHGLHVIEDCAQSIGAKYNGRNVGTFGDCGTLSFFPTKNLGAFGDGGAILTNNKTIAEKLKQLRVHGSSKRYVHDYIGLNSRLDEIQAAVLRVKLKYLDKWNHKRQNAAKYYDKLFAGIKEIITPSVKPNCSHIFHQYTIRLQNRDYLYEKLREKEIETIIYYPIPIHLQKAFAPLGYKKGSLPQTETMCNEILSLPMYPEIKPEVQEYVVENIQNILKEV